LAVPLRFIPYLGIVITAAFPLALAIAIAPGWTLPVWTGLLFVGIETIVPTSLNRSFTGAQRGSRRWR
jgi:predicted PurR-regulated permease PerM